MLPLEQIIPYDYRSQITIDSRIDPPLYIFKLSEVYSSLKSVLLCMGKTQSQRKSCLIDYFNLQRYIYIYMYICMHIFNLLYMYVSTVFFHL